MIVGLAAGGPTDANARIIAQWLSEHMGQQFAVENPQNHRSRQLYRFRRRARAGKPQRGHGSNLSALNGLEAKSAIMPSTATAEKASLDQWYVIDATCDVTSQTK